MTTFDMILAATVAAAFALGGLWLSPLWKFEGLRRNLTNARADAGHWLARYSKTNFDLIVTRTERDAALSDARRLRAKESQRLARLDEAGRKGRATQTAKRLSQRERVIEKCREMQDSLHRRETALDIPQKRAANA